MGRPPRLPLELTDATIRRLDENNPIYRFVDYYTVDGFIDTMTIEEYKNNYQGN